MDTPGPLYPSTYAATQRIILDRSARLGIVGLDYVGLDLAISFSRAGFVVDGFDTDPGRVAMLRSRKSYLSRISSAQILEAKKIVDSRPEKTCLPYQKPTSSSSVSDRNSTKIGMRIGGL